MLILKPNSRTTAQHTSDVSLAHALIKFFQRSILTKGADGFDPDFAAQVDWPAAAKQELARRALQQLPEEVLHHMLATPALDATRVIDMATGHLSMHPPCRLMPWLRDSLVARYGKAAPEALVAALEPFEDLLTLELGRPLVAVVADAVGAFDKHAHMKDWRASDWPPEHVAEVITACEAVIEALGCESARRLVPTSPAARTVSPG